MITACNHCGAKYELPDKMLGKQGRCKACHKVFVIKLFERDADDEMIELPDASGSTARMSAVYDDEPVRRSMSPRHSTDAKKGRVRTRKAKGAGAAMGLGITAAALTVGGGVCALIAMVSDNQSLVLPLGGGGLGLTGLGLVLAMMAIVNASSAGKAIRRARHPLSGRGEVTTGTITGLASLILAVLTFAGAGIWLAQRGGITFQEEISADQAQ